MKWSLGTSQMNPAKRLLMLWEYSEVSQQKGELKVKKKALVLHYSFHHLKLVWTQWCSWWQWDEPILLVCFPWETAPELTGTDNCSCSSVLGWWAFAHGLGLTQLLLLGLGQGTALLTKVVEEGEWSFCVMDAGCFPGSCPWECCLWLGRRGGTTPAGLGSLGQGAGFWGDSAMTCNVQHSIQRVSQRSGHCRGEGRKQPGLGLPRDPLGRHSWLQLKRHWLTAKPWNRVGRKQHVLSPIVWLWICLES